MPVRLKRRGQRRRALHAWSSWTHEAHKSQRKRGSDRERMRKMTATSKQNGGSGCGWLLCRRDRRRRQDYRRGRRKSTSRSCARSPPMRSRRCFEPMFTPGVRISWGNLSFYCGSVDNALIKRKTESSGLAFSFNMGYHFRHYGVLI